MARRGLTPAFKVTLLVTVFLTVLCFVGVGIIAMDETPSRIARQLADHLLKGGDLGLGAVFGLLGGASLSR